MFHENIIAIKNKSYRHYLIILFDGESYHALRKRLTLDRENGRGTLQYSKDVHNLEMEVEALHQLQNLYSTLSGRELNVDL